MKKRILAMLMIGLISINLAACADSSSTVSEKAEEEKKEESETVELTVWAILSSDIDDYVTNYQSQWYEEKTGVKINWINVPAQGWADSFQLSVMGGEYPDIYLYDFATSEVDICVDYGVIIPLNDLIEEYCPNIKAYLENNSEVKESITANDGNIYTLFSESYNLSAYSQKLWVNKNWLEQYTVATGNEMPKTTDEFEAMLTYFKDNDMNGNGDTTDEIPFLGCQGQEGVLGLSGAFVPSNSSREGFGCYLDESGETQFAYNTEEFRQSLMYIHELYEKGLFSDQSFTISTDDRLSYTCNDGSETAGVVTAMNISQIVQLSTRENSLDYSDYVAIPPLEGPNGVCTTVTQSEQSLALKNAITTSCEYQEEAAKWLDYWYSEEGRLWSINGGLENEHWIYEEGETIDGNGKVVKHLTDDINDNFCWNGQGVAYMVTEEDFHHIDISDLAINSNLATYVANRKYGEYLVESGWHQIVWANEEDADIMAEYSEKVQLIKDYVTQSFSEFIIGKRDIYDDSEWNTYLEELDNIGVERFTELVKYYIELGNQ